MGSLQWYGNQAGGWGRGCGDVVFSKPSSHGNGQVRDSALHRSAGKAFIVTQGTFEQAVLLLALARYNSKASAADLAYALASI